MRYYEIKWTLLMPDGSVERRTSQGYDDGQEAAYDVYQHWHLDGRVLDVTIQEVRIVDVPEATDHDARG